MSWQLGSTALRGSIVRTDTGLFCARARLVVPRRFEIRSWMTHGVLTPIRQSSKT